MAPDSWAFWQGSVSILDERGYRLFLHGTPIKEWPPLYSSYLAAWQFFFGVSGRVLIAAQAALAGLATFGWTRLSLALTWKGQVAQGRYFWLAGYAQALFIALFIAVRFDCIRADNLKYVLLPVLMAIAERAWLRGSRPPFVRLCAGIGAVGMALMLTHMSSIAFIGAAIVLVLTAKQIPRGTRVAGCLAIAVLSLAPWLVSRSLLHQGGSHRLGLAVGAYGPVTYLVQIIGGSSTLLIKQPWLSAPLAIALGVAAWSSRQASALPERTRSRLQARLLFVASAMLILFAVFNVTYIADKLTGRFIYFVPLSLVPIAMSLLATSTRPRWLFAASALVLLAEIPRVLDLTRGIQYSHDGLRARTAQIVRATDCIRRPDSLPSWQCSEGTTARFPPE